MAATNAEAGERYTIRQKIFKIFGDSFHIYGEDGELVGYCRMKALRLREDLRFYTDESRETELFSMRARSILDFSTTYDVAFPSGEGLGSLRRKGMRSILRDEWMLFDEAGLQIGRVIEDSSGAAMVRRVVPLMAMLMPQRFHLEDADGGVVAVFRTHFNPFVYRLGVRVLRDDNQIDDLLILASACLIAAIEGRQGDGGGGAGLFSGN
jgi:uncharacterized protein YxjI